MFIIELSLLEKCFHNYDLLRATNLMMFEFAGYKFYLGEISRIHRVYLHT